MIKKEQKPDYTIEESLIAKGFRRIVGVDEVGRGPLAGPVVVAAVVLDPQNIPQGLNDSKKLSKKKREALYEMIVSTAEVALSSKSAPIIDRLNIRAASLAAMVDAISALPHSADFALIDGRDIPKDLEIQAEPLIKGDTRSVSIAAASIVAKVVRDRMMQQATLTYPHYGFERHVGYGTELHKTTLEKNGPTPLHRWSFSPLKEQKNPPKGGS